MWVALAPTLLGIAASIVAILVRRPWLGLIAVIPVGTGLFLKALGTVDLDMTRPEVVSLNLAVIAMGVISGHPITATVLSLVPHKTISEGKGGSAKVSKDDAQQVHENEVLRGGATIGFLERFAVIAAIVLSSPEIVIVLIAIKGLGRFTELATSAIRERFIIGTLVSLTWAGACALLIA